MPATTERRSIGRPYLSDNFFTGSDGGLLIDLDRQSDNARMVAVP
jgi:hypothetical protein